MGSSSGLETVGRVADPIHGTVPLTKIEREILDTATFQRLRRIKQLGFSHLTFPNANHTRFAHSIGVLSIMSRIIEIAGPSVEISDKTKQDLRLAALLHDIGHHPYSHVLEKVDRVELTDDFIASGGSGRQIDLSSDRMPGHEELGRILLASQPDILKILGERRSRRVALIMTGSKVIVPMQRVLIHSSMDMDRMDYLVRDAYATGVPQGRIDCDYLLSNLRISPNGVLGVSHKAMGAAEHFLFARFFMYKNVYMHKTTLAFEAACRQALRRCIKLGRDNFPSTRAEIENIYRSSKLLQFNDQSVDKLFIDALSDRSATIRLLSESIVHRKPPKLVREVESLIEPRQRTENNCHYFLGVCRERLRGLARKYGIPIGCLLLSTPRPVRIEPRGASIPVGDASGLLPEKEEELLKVFEPPEPEPLSLVDMNQSLISVCGEREYKVVRLYVVGVDGADLGKMRAEVARW